MGKELKSLESINEFIKNNRMVLIYFFSEECGVCRVLRPKINKIMLRYPKIASARVEMKEVSEAAGNFFVFTLPTILFYIDQVEFIREARFINTIEIEKRISRYYNMLMNN